MINNLTATEQLSIIVQVFAKIAYNFWPVIVLSVIVFAYLAYTERQAK